MLNHVNEQTTATRHKQCGLYCMAHLHFPKTSSISITKDVLYNADSTVWPICIFLRLAPFLLLKMYYNCSFFY